MTTARARALRKTMSIPEATMWNALRELKTLGHHFRRQVPLGPYYADFASHSLKLVIEIDGDTHGSDDAIAYDHRRDAFIASHGYKILRIPNAEVTGNLDGVVTYLLSEFDARAFELAATPTLFPSPQGGGRSADEIAPPRLPPPCGEGRGGGEPETQSR